MRFTGTNRRFRFGAFVIVVAASAEFSLPALRAQQPSSSDQIQQLMMHRREMSNRAVEEPTQRRFEEGKSDSTFPSDTTKAIKGGVVPAFTPEERKALQHNERGLELFSAGKLDAAIKEYQESIHSDPKLAAAHNNLGSAYFAAARFEEAAVAFRRACDLDANYGQAFFNLALTHIKLGHQKDASEMLDQAFRAYNSAGEAYLKASRLQEAEEAFRGMLQIDPAYSPALLRLGLVYNAAGRFEEAAGNVRRVIEREPANAGAHEILAEALYGEQKYEEAAFSADRAIKLAPAFADAHYLAGLARASLGQRDVALVHLARLQQLGSTELAQQLSDFINRKTPASKSRNPQD